MDETRNSVSDPGARRHLRVAHRGDDGVGIIEILVAFAVFMACFLPLLEFLPTGAGVVSNSIDQRAAISIANTVLTNAQNSLVPPVDDPSLQYAVNGWSAATVSPDVEQGGVDFKVYTAGGWCASPTAPGNGPVPSSPAGQPSYHLVVKVAWGRGASATSTTNKVTDSTELSTLTNAPASGTVLASCPLVLP